MSVAGGICWGTPPARQTEKLYRAVDGLIISALDPVLQCVCFTCDHEWLPSLLCKVNDPRIILPPSHSLITVGILVLHA